MVNEAKSFLIGWNNTFPLDRWYRKRYNIPFNSEQHKNASQIDIYLEWLEEEVYEEHEVSMKERERKKALFTKGEWLTKPELPEEETDELWDKIKF